MVFNADKTTVLHTLAAIPPEAKDWLRTEYGWVYAGLVVRPPRKPYTRRTAKETPKPPPVRSGRPVGSRNRYRSLAERHAAERAELDARCLEAFDVFRSVNRAAVHLGVTKARVAAAVGRRRSGG
ncbi:hypothetical protein [Paludisphaera mucosa]|uniref:Uncharacterized protein n=1 Tax=Paludisphaera mucosa TaxID=3030827 RepID=A0ABT6FLY2_9BACT|nr:hypothetical protein [Paludisphaera mucosa]MDG3008501.1 hypothetical protein [Paludisphaera mucosa]